MMSQLANILWIIIVWFKYQLNAKPIKKNSIRDENGGENSGECILSYIVYMQWILYYHICISTVDNKYSLFFVFIHYFTMNSHVLLTLSNRLGSHIKIFFSLKVFTILRIFKQIPITKIFRICVHRIIVKK